jgi:hypothetical protein
MGSPVQETRYGNSPLANPSAPGPIFLGLLSLLPPEFRWTLKNFYGYVAEFLPLVAATTQNAAIGIQQDSDFVITYATSIVTDVANLVALSFVPQLVQLQDAAAGASFFLTPSHFMNVYGDAANPGIFAVPYIMGRSSTLTVMHTNLEAVNRNVRCTFNGFKTYPGTDTRDPRWQRRAG